MNITFYIISILIFLMIMSYGKIIRDYMNGNDILEKNVMNCMGCDGWGIIHFILFIIYGYLFPDKHIFFLTLSILWELFETYVGTHKIIIGGKRFKMGDSSNMYEPNENHWWYGRVSDIAFNMAGYIIGDCYRRTNFWNFYN